MSPCAEPSPGRRGSERPGKRGHSDPRCGRGRPARSPQPGSTGRDRDLGRCSGRCPPRAPGPRPPRRVDPPPAFLRAPHPVGPAHLAPPCPAPPAPPGLNRYPPACRSPPSGPAAGPASPRAGRRAPLLRPARRRCLRPPDAQLRAAPARHLPSGRRYHGNRARALCACSARAAPRPTQTAGAFLREHRDPGGGAWEVGGA